MKIWHYSILNQLPTQLLTALHRDCCALRGRSWGKATTPELKWLWNYPIASLEWYHLVVIGEMESRKWNPNPNWKKSGYRGRKSPPIPEKWKTVPPNWPEGLMFEEMGPNYLYQDQKALKAWERAHKH